MYSVESVSDLLPSYSKLAQIFSSIPATSCSAERSFSALWKIKTYLRSTMGQERLSNVAILNIKREITILIMNEKMNDLINAFAN